MKAKQTLISAILWTIIRAERRIMVLTNYDYEPWLHRKARAIRTESIQALLDQEHKHWNK